MTQRRRLAAALKAGLASSVSTRALIILLPILMSLAHDGTRPHRTDRSSRVAGTAGSSFGERSSTARTGCVGATFHDGSGSSPITSTTSNAFANSASVWALAYRPHMSGILQRRARRCRLFRCLVHRAHTEPVVSTITEAVAQ